MSDYLIVVVNRASARFFTLEPVAFPKIESGPRIKPHAELVNAEIKSVKDVFTDSKTGRGTAPQGGGVHGYDDKRDQHLDELRRRFATRVLKRIHKLRQSEDAGTVILAASARMRRFLFPEMDDRVRQGYRFHKVSKNMINFSPQKIHEYLAGEGLVPRQQKP
jgi:hypothetical protein